MFAEKIKGRGREKRKLNRGGGNLFFHQFTNKDFSSSGNMWLHINFIS